MRFETGKNAAYMTVKWLIIALVVALLLAIVALPYRSAYAAVAPIALSGSEASVNFRVSDEYEVHEWVKDASPPVIEKVKPGLQQLIL